MNNHNGTTARLRLAITKRHGLTFPVPAKVSRHNYRNRLLTCAAQAGLRIATRWMGAAFLVTARGSR